MYMLEMDGNADFDLDNIISPGRIGASDATG